MSGVHPQQSWCCFNVHNIGSKLISWHCFKFPNLIPLLFQCWNMLLFQRLYPDIAATFKNLTYVLFQQRNMRLFQRWSNIILLGGRQSFTDHPHVDSTSHVCMMCGHLMWQYEMMKAHAVPPAVSSRCSHIYSLSYTQHDVWVRDYYWRIHWHWWLIQRAVHGESLALTKTFLC